jgi:D-3-phosphoglycerate dehydrogenase / 2-oxoglutarate reductase
MRALTSCALSAKLVQALETQWDWQVDTVDSVTAAAAGLSAADRQSVRAIIVEAEPVTGALMDALPNLEVIAAMRSEPVNVDIAAASARALPVIHTPGRNAESVADFTLGLTLAMLRSIAITHHLIMNGDMTRATSRAQEVGRTGDVIWRPDDPAEPIPYIAYKGRELSSLVIGVIGYGAVGKVVAERFRPLVREVMVVDPAVSGDAVTAAGLTMASLASMLPRADVVTVHARSASVIIGQAELALMRPGSYLINTARATVLDYEALVRALHDGRLCGAALDVYPEEPLPRTSSLLAAPRLTLTPHLAGATEEVRGRMNDIALQALTDIYHRTDWTGVAVRNRQVQQAWTRDLHSGRTPQPATEEVVGQ